LGVPSAELDSGKAKEAREGGKKTVPCEKEEFALIGAFIQAYCAVDFNARRIIAAVQQLSKQTPPINFNELNDTDVYLHLKKASENAHVESHVKDGIAKAASTLEMHRDFRHRFAHWVVRKVCDHEALFLLTGKKPDPKKHGGIDIAKGTNAYLIVPRAALIEETKKIFGHADYLAHVAVHLENKLQVAK
jgi:hypothetical protein